MLLRQIARKAKRRWVLPKRKLYPYLLKLAIRRQQLHQQLHLLQHQIYCAFVVKKRNRASTIEIFLVNVAFTARDVP